MKRFILLLSTVFMIFMLCACTSDENKNEFNTPTMPEFDNNVNFSSTVLIDKWGIRVTALDFQVDDNLSGEAKLSLLYENFSSKKLNIDTEIITVNGYSTGASTEYGGIKVDANDKETMIASVDFVDNTYKSEVGLLELGIRKISEIEVECRVTNSSGEHICSATKVIQVGNSDSSNEFKDCFLAGAQDGSLSALTRKKVVEISELEACNIGDIEPVIAVLTESDDGQEIFVELRNTGNKPVDYYIEDVEINGLLLNNYPDSSPYNSATISAGARSVSRLNITPSELIKDCFNINEIAKVSFSVCTRETTKRQESSKRIEFIIPGRSSDLDLAGTKLYDKNGITVACKGVYKTFVGYTDLTDDGHWTSWEEPEYSLVFYVNNQNSEKADIVLDSDSLFFNYKKIPFATYETWGGTNLRNFGNIPANSSGYIVFKMDPKAMEQNGFSDPANITDVELKLGFDYYHTEDATRVSFKLS